MKNSFLIMCVIIALICGCTTNNSSGTTKTSSKPSTGINISIKQPVPLNPQANIVINEAINFSNTTTGKPLAYMLENSYFEIPFDIQNNNKYDYDNLLIRVGIQSPVIPNMSLYSYSGAPLARQDNGTFSLGTKSISQQTNSLLLIGKTTGVPGNLSSGEFNIVIELYNNTIDQPIPKTYTQKKLKICKQKDCA